MIRSTIPYRRSRLLNSDYRSNCFELLVLRTEGRIKRRSVGIVTVPYRHGQKWIDRRYHIITNISQCFQKRFFFIFTGKTGSNWSQKYMYRTDISMFTETFRKIQEKEKITNINGTGGNSLTYWTIVPVPISKKKLFIYVM